MPPFFRYGMYAAYSAAFSLIDSDSTARKGAIDEALGAATTGRADILVGTQMLSKGHHFPKLTLVAVVNADQGLFGTDFRSDERLAQSIALRLEGAEPCLQPFLLMRRRLGDLTC